MDPEVQDILENEIGLEQDIVSEAISELQVTENAEETEI